MRSRSCKYLPCLYKEQGVGGRKGSGVSLASGKALLSLNLHLPHPEIPGNLEKQTQKLFGHHLKYFISLQSAERLHGTGGFLTWNLSGPTCSGKQELERTHFVSDSQIKTEAFCSFGEKGTLSDSLRSYRGQFSTPGHLSSREANVPKREELWFLKKREDGSLQ